MAKSPEKLLNLALQGGGAHGAYTWGVLDRLLEEEDLEIHAVSGTSAGAMNAAMLASGYRRGGREGAKKKLQEFWWEVSVMGAWFNPVRTSLMDELQHHWGLDNNLPYQWVELMVRLFSPAQLNPLNINPLRGLLKRLLDIEAINAGGQIPIFVTATNVHSGQPRVFKCEEITVDVLMASACIPFYSQAVVVDGVPYWDGGYMGNPSIWPLIYNTHIHDVLLVQINPIYRDTTPTSAHEIINRLNEINFNASLIDEMRAVNFVTKLIREGRLDKSEYKDMHMHMIPSPDVAYGLDASSKMNTDWGFFQFLKDIGRRAAETWLKENKTHIGVRGTVDIESEFLGITKPDIHKIHQKSPDPTPEDQVKKRARA